MAYSKHTWSNGEVITADKMNNLEEVYTDVRNQILNIHSIPEYHYGSIGSGLAESEEYFKAWIEKVYADNNTVVETPIVACVNPNVRGVVFGFLYSKNSNETPQYCSFIYISFNRVAHFGYSGGTWFYREL